MAALTLVAVGACAPADDEFVCPSTRPASCPAPPPSYVADVAPLVSAHCFPCHDHHGAAGDKWYLGTRADLAAHKGPVYQQVYACAMPLGGEHLTSDQRTLLLAWLTCDAPDN